MTTSATQLVRPARLGLAGVVALAWLAGALAPCLMTAAEAAPMDAHSRHGLPVDTGDEDHGCCPPADTICDGDCAEASHPGCADTTALASERHDPRPDLLPALHDSTPAPVIPASLDPALPHATPPVVAGAELRTRHCSFLE